MESPSSTNLPIIKAYKINDNAILPEKKSKFASGYDVYSDIKGDDPLMVFPGQTVKIPTGIAFDIPEDWEIQIRPRSGLSSNGIAVAFGTVDSDYKDEVKIVLTNTTSDAIKIENHFRIAQAVPHKKDLCEIIDGGDYSTIDRTNDRGGGFGHTGN